MSTPLTIPAFEPITIIYIMYIYIFQIIAKKTVKKEKRKKKEKRGASKCLPNP